MKKSASKLNVKKDSITTFSIKDLKDFEGCPPAAKYLATLYGHGEYNLLASKKKIFALVNDGKADWVINFMLNLLKPKHRMEFYGKYLDSALKRIEDDEIKKGLEQAFTYYCKNQNENTTLKLLGMIESHLIPINSELQYHAEQGVIYLSEDVVNTLQYEKHVIESVRFFLEDKERKFTRSITDGLMKLAESKCYLDFVEYKYEETIQEIAFELMEYTELWSGPNE